VSRPEDAAYRAAMNRKAIRTASERCEVCRAPLVSDLAARALSNWTDCASCESACTTFRARVGEDSDPDYVYHELAHHVVLYRRLPGEKRDWQSIARALMDWTIGRLLHHELRVIALQYVVQKKLGWRPSADRLVSLSWDGLRDVANAALDNRAVFEGRAADDLSRTTAVRHVRRLRSEVSSRHVTMYANAVRELRGEA